MKTLFGQNKFRAVAFLILACVSMVNGQLANNTNDGRIWLNVVCEGKPVAGAGVRWEGVRVGGVGLTDQRGRIFVYRVPDAVKLSVWTDKVSVAVDAASLTNEMRIELPSEMGTVKGRLWKGDVPWTNQTVWLDQSFHSLNFKKLPRTTTDAEGRFEFRKVMATQWTIRQADFTWGNVVVPPAGVVERELGRSNCTIIARAVLTNSTKSVAWTNSEVFLITHDRTNMRFHAGAMENDGSIIVPEAKPGEYDLYVSVQEGDRHMGRTIAYSGPVRVVVPTNAAPGSVMNLGNVAITVKPELTLGMRAPDFEVKAFDGRMVHLSEFTNQIVLLTFWWESQHSWDRGRREEIKKFHDAYQKQDRLVMIGVSLRGDDEEARAAVKEAEWNWLQVGLIPGQSRFFDDRYELHDTPWNILIDAEGRVLGKSANIKDLKPALDAALMALNKTNWPPGKLDERPMRNQLQRSF